MKINKLHHLSFLLLISVFICNAQVNNESVRMGRKIQLDGFLLDWSSKEANQWDSGKKWFWDAVQTSEGLAGYFRSSDSLQCKHWVFSFSSADTSNKIATVVINNDSLSSSAYYQIDLGLYQNSRIFTCEWLIPYAELKVDTSKNYYCHISGVSGCQDTLQTIVLKGTLTGKNKKATWSDVAQRVVLIVILAIMLLYVSRKIRKPGRKV
jgi:hypothetical protein